MHIYIYLLRMSKRISKTYSRPPESLTRETRRVLEGQCFQGQGCGFCSVFAARAELTVPSGAAGERQVRLAPARRPNGTDIAHTVSSWPLLAGVGEQPFPGKPAGCPGLRQPGPPRPERRTHQGRAPDRAEGPTGLRSRRSVHAKSGDNFW